MRCLVVLGPMRAWMKWALAGVAIAVIAVGSAFIGAAIDDDKATAAPAANTGVETGRLGHAGAPWQENEGRPWRVTPSPAAEPTPPPAAGSQLGRWAGAGVHASSPLPAGVTQEAGTHACRLPSRTSHRIQPVQRPGGILQIA
jgi:hypothetical protein